MLKSNPFLFTVTRREPQLIAPAKPTPRVLKPLSEIDDQSVLRFHVPVMQFYPGDVNGDTRDPVKVIREALAEALVYYYPFAGRLREGPGRKLAVDCTAEGVVFVEAIADFTLEDFSREKGGFLRPPFSCDLFCDVPCPSGILNSPLLLIQVTRFRCGGFVLAICWSHAMSDAAGIVEFMKAMVELSRGGSRPVVLPVWSRELLLARDPPRVTCTHREYDQVAGTVFPIEYSDERVIERSFYFGRAELSAILSRLLQPRLKHYSTFDLLSAFLWRCRTLALRYNPSEVVQFICVINAQLKLNPRLPVGYYGNTIVLPGAVSTAGELASNDFDYTVELIRQAKAEATEEYVRSVIDLMAIHDRPHLTVPGTWVVFDTTKLGFQEIDFGWGEPVCGGLATSMIGVVPGQISGYVKGKNIQGESGVLLLICLPETAMERFSREVASVESSHYQGSRL